MSEDDWREDAVESKNYRRLRAKGRAKRAMLERGIDRTQTLADDDWTVEAGRDGERLKRVPVAPTAVADILAGIVGNRRWDDRLQGVSLFDLWPDVVGAELAQHVTPVRLAGGVLVVEVSSPPWATQVTYLAEELIERCNDALPHPMVTKIEVRVARR